MLYNHRKWFEFPVLCKKYFYNWKSQHSKLLLINKLYLSIFDYSLTNSSHNRTRLCETFTPSLIVWTILQSQQTTPTQRCTTKQPRNHWPARHTPQPASARIAQCMACSRIKIINNCDYDRWANGHQAVAQQHPRYGGQLAVQGHANHRDDEVW